MQIVASLELETINMRNNSFSRVMFKLKEKDIPSYVEEIITVDREDPHPNYLLLFLTKYNPLKTKPRMCLPGLRQRTFPPEINQEYVKELAKIGFIYKEEKITCFSCRFTTDLWGSHQEIYRRHFLSKPNCPYIYILLQTGYDNSAYSDAVDYAITQLPELQS